MCLAGRSKISEASPCKPRPLGRLPKFYEETLSDTRRIACLPAFAAGQVVEEIVTRVNGQIITLSEFQRSKDQLRDDVKQQDPANADKLLPSAKRTFCAISSTSNSCWKRAKTSTLLATPTSSSASTRCART